MVKIAITSKDGREVKEVLNLLSGNYEISAREDKNSDRQFVSIATLHDPVGDEIRKMLDLIEAATGANPAKNNVKSRYVVRAKSAASYILRHRYGMSLCKVGYILNCHHTTIFARLKKMNNTNVGKTVPIEFAIRRALYAAENKRVV